MLIVGPKEGLGPFLLLGFLFLFHLLCLVADLDSSGVGGVVQLGSSMRERTATQPRRRIALPTLMRPRSTRWSFRAAGPQVRPFYSVHFVISFLFVLWLSLYALPSR